MRRGSKASPCSTDSLLFPSLVFLEIVNEKSRHSLHENMGKIKVPTQVIWGKQDQVRGPCASPTETHGLHRHAVAALRPAGTRVAPFPWVWTVGLGGVMDRKLRNSEHQGWGGEGTDEGAGAGHKVSVKRLVLTAGEESAVCGQNVGLHRAGYGGRSGRGKEVSCRQVKVQVVLAMTPLPKSIQGSFLLHTETSAVQHPCPVPRHGYHGMGLAP